jgi:hypothetical protein
MLFSWQDRSILSAVLPHATIPLFLTSRVAFVVAARPKHVQRASTMADEVAGSWPSQFIEAQPRVMRPV